jgi:hypothetical protein
MRFGYHNLAPRKADLDDVVGFHPIQRRLSTVRSSCKRHDTPRRGRASANVVGRLRSRCDERNQPYTAREPASTPRENTL